MNIKFRDALAFATAFFIAVSASYLFAYWGAFNINVLEFISLSDLAKLALYPIVASLFFAAVGVAIGEIGGRNFPAGGGGESKVKVFVFAYWRVIFILLCNAIILTWFYVPHPYNIALLAVLVLPFPTALGNTELAIKWVPNPNLRYLATFILVMLPTASFLAGHEKAANVKAGKSSLVVDVQRSQLSLHSSLGSPVIYMGLLGDTYILYEHGTSSIVFAKQRSETPLILTKRN